MYKDVKQDDNETNDNNMIQDKNNDNNYSDDNYNEIMTKIILTLHKLTKLVNGNDK